MKCLFLAAGYATRLYPLTENFPKPLLPVAKRPILDHLLADIDATGAVNAYAVVTNSKFSPHFSKWAASHDSVHIDVVDDGTCTNETRLGAVKDILYAIEKLGLDEDLLIVAGDNLLDFSLGDFVAYAVKKDASCVMRYFEANKQRLRKCGVISIDGNDRVLEMREKPADPKSNWCCPPFYFYKKADIARIKEAIADGCGVDAPGSLAAWMVLNSTVYAMEMPGKRYDIGTLESYKTVCDFFEK